MEKLELPPLTLGVGARVEKITQFSKGINFLDFVLIDGNCQYKINDVAGERATKM